MPRFAAISPAPSPAQLLGDDDSQLINHGALNCRLQTEPLTALLQLRNAAQVAGFDLRVASSYRDFARQLLIWNAKAQGQRPVLDSRGAPLNIQSLSKREQVFAILRWSALPGASRHHWGTDLDVYDASRMPEGYQLQLTYEETCGDGICADFHHWLDGELQHPQALFYRPYAQDNGGIAPEPWHLSYAPLAQHYQAALSLALLQARLERTDIALKDTLLENLPEIYQRFVQVDSQTTPTISFS